MSSAFIQAAVILLREGLEAMLVIAALAGYLSKAGAGHRIQALYGGSLAAVGARIIAAWLFAGLTSGEQGRQRAGGGLRLGGRRARLPRGISRRRPNRAVHHRACGSRGWLDRWAV